MLCVPDGSSRGQCSARHKAALGVGKLRDQVSFSVHAAPDPSSSPQAKSSGQASSYQLRVEDVAHLSHLDETTNTYVNTTDLQKLVASVRAKDKSSEGRLPTPPRLLHQTPAPYCPPTQAPTQQGDKVVLRAPMPPPHSGVKPQLPPPPQTVQEEVMYSNLQECSAPPPSIVPLKPPKTSPPPPPPAKEANSSVKQPARPAPAPPKPSGPSPQENGAPSSILVPQEPSGSPQVRDTHKPAQRIKPMVPPVALKPGKVTGGVAKPTPPKLPVLPKPGKGKALPPLKMGVLGGGGAATPDTTCSTPGTATSLLSPVSTPPVGQAEPSVGSISAKIAMLEGQMRTAGGAAPWLGGKPGLSQC